MSKFVITKTERHGSAILCFGVWVNTNTRWPTPHTGSKQIAKNIKRNPLKAEFPPGFIAWSPPAARQGGTVTGRFNAAYPSSSNVPRERS